jgi:hypothetical protein
VATAGLLGVGVKIGNFEEWEARELVKEPVLGNA